MICKRLNDNEISDIIRQAAAQGSPIARKKAHESILKGTSFVVARYTERYKKMPAYEDLNQVGLSALYQAIYTFNPDKCPRFYGWAAPWIRKNVAISAYKIKKYFEYNDFDSDAMEIASATLYETTPEDVYLTKERDKILWRAVSETGHLGSFVIKNLFGADINSDQTIESISSKTNLSRHRIETACERAINTLKQNDELRMAIA
jgi:RNA polymerase sigma factor (sigma-70 family)